MLFWELARQLAEALVCLEHSHIVHLDIKVGAAGSDIHYNMSMRMRSSAIFPSDRNGCTGAQPMSGCKGPSLDRV